MKKQGIIVLAVCLALAIVTGIILAVVLQKDVSSSISAFIPAQTSTVSVAQAGHSSTTTSASPSTSSSSRPVSEPALAPFIDEPEWLRDVLLAMREEYDLENMYRYFGYYQPPIAGYNPIVYAFTGSEILYFWPIENTVFIFSNHGELFTEFYIDTNGRQYLGCWYVDGNFYHHDKGTHTNILQCNLMNWDNDPDSLTPWQFVTDGRQWEEDMPNTYEAIEARCMEILVDAGHGPLHKYTQVELTLPQNTNWEEVDRTLAEALQQYF